MGSRGDRTKLPSPPWTTFPDGVSLAVADDLGILKQPLLDITVPIFAFVRRTVTQVYRI